jgi:serine/threonine-protein kinase
LVVLGVVLALGAGFVAVKLGIIPAGRKAPAFVGMAEADARALIGSAGLSASFEVVDDTLPAGLVVAQAPVAGARFGQRDTLRMSVSSGQVRVPELVGSSLAQAREVLAKAALVLVKVDSQYSDSQGPGVVMVSGPKGGSRVKPRAEVTLTVANGRATCPECRARRAPGANFCEKCGYQF